MNGRDSERPRNIPGVWGCPCTTPVSSIYLSYVFNRLKPFIAPFSSKPYQHLHPLILSHHLTALTVHLLHHLSRWATGLLLVGLRSLLQLSFRYATGGNVLPDDQNMLDHLPIHIRMVTSRFNLDPHTRPYVCCPVCFALYGTRPVPGYCTHEGADIGSGNICGTSLWHSQTIRGRLFLYPSRVFMYQELKGWLARLLCRHGVEDIMDTANSRAQGDPPFVMKDIWDAPVVRDLKMNGVPFVCGPPDKGRYIFALSVDLFNPFQSKEAGQNVAVTGFHMVCLNLPPHLRYLPENVYLVCIIPGPHKLSKDELNHFLKPLVNELLVFWNSRVFFTHTAKYHDSCLVRCALLPLVCDLPAARQTAGFGAHNARFFCSVCKLEHSDINSLNKDEWVPRTCDEHKTSARAWRHMSSQDRQAAFKLNSIRWSELLELPYWDPIWYTVINSMHNFYLGLLKTHCRKVWGMDALTTEPGRAYELQFVPPQPAENTLTLGMQYLHSGSDNQLASCSRKALRYLCFTEQIQCWKNDKNHLLDLLKAWVSAPLARCETWLLLKTVRSNSVRGRPCMGFS